MFNNYEKGGILKAITDSKKKIKSVDTSDESEERKNALDKLFSYEHQVDEVAVTQEDIETLLNIPDLKDESDKRTQKRQIQEKNESDKRTQKRQIQEKNEKKKKIKKEKIKESPEREGRTIFLGNVSVDVTRKEIKKLFMKFGEIETVRVRSVPGADPKVPKKVALIKKQFHSERNNMNAYVVFKTQDAADKAMSCNGIKIKDLHIRVDKCNNTEHEHKKSLFVGNLPFGCLEEDLRCHFAVCGEIDHIRLIRDKATGMGKGFGYVQFKSTDGVAIGLKLNGSSFKDRELRVYRSTAQGTKGKSKPSYQGLKSTTRKDMEKGKKLFSQKASNAIRRIQNNKQKQAQQRHSKNKQKNMQKKVYNKTSKK